MNSTSLTAHGMSNWHAFSHLVETRLLAALPTSPGVYAILLPQPEPRRQAASDIAYIGLAVNQKGLRGRVRQYFHPGHRRPRTSRCDSGFAFPAVLSNSGSW